MAGRDVRHGAEAGEEARQRAKEQDQRDGDSGERDGPEGARRSFAIAENSKNARAQSGAGLMAVQSHSKMQPGAALFFEAEQRGGVDGGIGTGGDRDVVAAQLALFANAAADPPDRGVEEEEGFDQGLEKVPEVVGAADVGELVREHDFKLLGAEAGERGDGKQDPRADDPRGERIREARGEAQIDEARDVHLAAEDVEPEEQRVGRLLKTRAHAPDQPPSAEGAEGEQAGRRRATGRRGTA